METPTTTQTKREPLPRVDLKRKLVCVYSKSLGSFEVYAITQRGLVSKMFAPEISYKPTVEEAFRTFSVPFAGFRAIPAVDKKGFQTWNGYVEGVWAAANKK